MRPESRRIFAALERERQERLAKASGLPLGLTAAEFAERWDVTEAQATDFLRRFIEAGFAMESSGRYYATVKALSLNLPMDEEEAAA